MNICSQGNSCTNNQCASIHPRQVVCTKNHQQYEYCQYFHPNPNCQSFPQYQQIPYSQPPPFITNNFQYYPPGQNFYGHRQKFRHHHHQHRGFMQHKNRNQGQQQKHHGWGGRDHKGHRGCKRKWQEVGDLNEITTKMSQMKIKDEILMMNDRLTEMGHKNRIQNIAVLEFLQGNFEMAQKILREAKQSAQNFKGNEKQSEIEQNFFILKGVGFDQIIGDHKIWKILNRFGGDLNTTISRLMKKVQIQQKKDIYKFKLDNLSQKYPFEFLEQLPITNNILLIDAFNVAPSNKNLRKLYHSQEVHLQLESLIRLRIFLQTLFEGYLVYDRQLLTKEIEEQIQNNLHINIEGKKLLKRVYAEPKTADQKIIQILLNMTKQQRQKVVLVTNDQELIQLCLEVCEGKLKIMGGFKLLKCAKKIHPKGLRHRILKNQ